MRIEILGTGCPKCKKLEENTRKALEGLKIQAKIEKVTDISKITERAALTPALVINGKLVSEGRIPDVEEIRNGLNRR